MSMDIAKFEGEITKIVENILEKQATAGIEKDVKDALKEAESTIKSLKDKVVDADTKASEDVAARETLESAKADLETELASKNDELDKLTNDNKNLLERAENAEKVIKGLEDDKLETVRMGELSEAKVARNGDALVKQAAAVREMTDEEFSSYKDEMVAIRTELMASVKSELESAGEETPEGETDESVNAEEGTTTPPADVEGALKEAAAVLPNAENASENKWQNFSTGLADLLKNTRGPVSKDNR